MSDFEAPTTYMFDDKHATDTDLEEAIGKSKMLTLHSCDAADDTNADCSCN